MNMREMTIPGRRQVALLTIVGASAVIVYGAYGDPEPKADQQAAVPFLILAAMLVAALIFGWLLPKAASSRKESASEARINRWAMTLSVIGLLLVPVAFWSGLPIVAGGAGALLGSQSHGTGSPQPSLSRRPAVVVGVLAVLADVGLIILSNTLL